MATPTKAQSQAKLEADRKSAAEFEQATGKSAGTTKPGPRKKTSRSHLAPSIENDQTLEAELARRKDRMRRIRQSDIRNSIDASAIKNKLALHILGGCDMTVTQVRAATYLLDKVVSNAPLEITGEDGGSIGGLAEALEAARARVARAKLGSA